MSNYRLVIEADTEKAKKDVKAIERVADSITEKKRQLKFEFPSFTALQKGLDSLDTEVNSATKSFKQFYEVAKMLPGALGENIRSWEQVFIEAQAAIKDTANVVATVIDTDKALNAALQITTGLIGGLVESLATIGFALQGLQNIIAPLQQAFAGLFDNTIGRAAEFRDTVLQTQTTLASTSKVFQDGKELTDPFEKIQALTGTIEQRIDSIRQRSLELAGVTSGEVVEVFNMVSSQISGIGGSLQDAEDLAINFAAALGTMNMPIRMAGEEIRALMQGTITADSYIARSLGITNADIDRAKTQVGGLVAFLNKKLETAVSGQAIAAQGLKGVMSNIRELYEMVSQYFGEGLLKPVVDAITWIYQRLMAIRDTFYAIATVAGKSIGNILKILGTRVSTGVEDSVTRGRETNPDNVRAGPITGIYRDLYKAPESAKAQEQNNKLAQQLTDAIGPGNVALLKNFAAQVESVILKALTLIQKLADQLAPNIIRAFEAIKPALENAFAVGRTYFDAIVKNNIARIEAWINALGPLANAFAGMLNVSSAFLNTWAQVLNMPIVQYISGIRAQMEIFHRIGGDTLTTLTRTISFLVVSGLPAIKFLGSALAFIWRTIGQVIVAFGNLNIVIGNVLVGFSALITSGAKIAAYFQGVSLGIYDLNFHIKQLKVVFTVLVQNVGTALSVLSGSVKTAIIGIQSSFVQAQAALSQTQQAFVSIVSGLSALFNGLSTSIAASLTGLSGPVAQVFASLKVVFQSFSTTLTGVGTQVKQAFANISAAAKTLGTGFTVAFGYIYIAFAQLKASIASFTPVFVALKASVVTLALQLWVPIKKLLIQIWEGFAQLLATLSPIFSKLKLQMIELGVQANKLGLDFIAMGNSQRNAMGTIIGFTKNLLKAGVQMLAFEVAMGVVLDAFSRYQKAQDDAKNKKDVQNALKDIAKYSGEAGKNMSALEKATLDVKKALVETRFNQLVEASVALESKIKKFQESGGGLKGLLTEDLSDMVARIFSNTFRGFGGGILGDGLFGRAELYGDDLRNKQKANQEELKALQDARDKQAKEQARIEANSPAGRLRAFQTELDLRNAQRNVTEQLNNLDIARGRLAGTLSDRRAEELQRLQEIASVSAQIKDKQELLEKKDTFNLDTKQVEQLKAEIAALETKGIQLRVDLQRSAVDKFIEDMQTNLQLSQQYQENAIARAVVEGQITPELASQLEITRQLGEVNKQILIARQELALKSTIFAADSTELKQIKNELASLEGQQINITAKLQKEEFDKGLREIQIQAAAVERSLQFKSTLISQQSNLAQAEASAAKAELGYMSTMLDIQEKMAALANEGVVPEQQRYEIAAKRLEIAIQQAQVEYAMAIASIRASIQQAYLDKERARLKANEIYAELKLAAAKGQSTQAYEDALDAANGSLEVANYILDTTIEIGRYQEQAANFVRATAIESAKAAYSQEKMAIAVERAQRNSQGLANNMRDAASSAGSYASNLQSAGSSGSGGGGYGGGMGGGDMSDIVPEYRDAVRSYGGVEGFKRAYGFDPTQSARDEANRKAKEFNEKFSQPNNAFFQFAGVGRAVEGIDPKLKSALIQEWQKIASGLNDAVNSFVPFGQQPLRREVDQFYRGDVGRNEFVTQEGNKRFANRFASPEERQYLNTAFALAEDNIINGPKRARVAEAQRIGATFAQFSTSAAQAAQQVLSAGIPRFALGGVVDKPTIALLAEAGEREFVIPESKMAATAARYLSNYTSGEASSTNAPAINITTGPVLEFEGNRYVTMDDFERGLRSTAEGVIGRLRTPSARIALGLR